MSDGKNKAGNRKLLFVINLDAGHLSLFRMNAGQGTSEADLTA